MADGAWKRIADVVAGDIVHGKEGPNTVVGTKKTTVQDRKMIKINGYDFFATDDHLFLTNNGWKTWRPDRLIDNNRENAVFLEGENRHHPLDKDDILINYTVEGCQIAYADLEIEEHDFDPDFEVYDLHLNKDSTYIVDGFVVHNCGGGGCGDGTGSGP
jgi:intein/homing endonuclease